MGEPLVYTANPFTTVYGVSVEQSERCAYTDNLWSLQSRVHRGGCWGFVGQGKVDLA